MVIPTLMNMLFLKVLPASGALCQKENLIQPLLRGPIWFPLQLLIWGVSCIVVPRVAGGYSPFESLPYRFLRFITGMTVVDHRIGQYAPREYLRMLEPLGIFSDDTTKKLVYSRKDEEDARIFLDSNLIKKGGIIIGISPPRVIK